MFKPCLPPKIQSFQPQVDCVATCRGSPAPAGCQAASFWGLAMAQKWKKPVWDHQNGQMVMFSRGIIQILVVDNFEPLLCLKLQKKKLAYHDLKMMFLDV